MKKIAARGMTATRETLSTERTTDFLRYVEDATEGVPIICGVYKGRSKAEKIAAGMAPEYAEDDKLPFNVIIKEKTAFVSQSGSRLLNTFLFGYRGKKGLWTVKVAFQNTTKEMVNHFIANVGKPLSNVVKTATRIMICEIDKLQWDQLPTERRPGLMNETKYAFRPKFIGDTLLHTLDGTDIYRSNGKIMTAEEFDEPRELRLLDGTTIQWKGDRRLIHDPTQTTKGTEALELDLGANDIRLEAGVTEYVTQEEAATEAAPVAGTEAGLEPQNKFAPAGKGAN